MGENTTEGSHSRQPSEVSLNGDEDDDNIALQLGPKCSIREHLEKDKVLTTSFSFYPYIIYCVFLLFQISTSYFNNNHEGFFPFFKKKDVTLLFEFSSSNILLGYWLKVYENVVRRI